MELRSLTLCSADRAGVLGGRVGADRRVGNGAMPTLECGRCGPIVLPEEPTQELRRQVADTVRAGSALAAVQILHDQSAMALKDAKALVFHMARRNGHCQRCDASVELVELARCPRCRALTITW